MEFPRRKILACCCMGSAALSFSINTPALCLTTISGEFHLDAAAGGFFLSCAFWGLFVGILLTGPLADRWGIRALLVSSAVCQAGGFVIASLAQVKLVLFFGAFVVGIGTGMTDALLTPLVCAVYPEARTRVSNLLHAFYPLGMLFIILLTLFLLHIHWTWRSIYQTMAVLCFPYGLGFLLLPLPRHLHAGADRLPTRQLMTSLPFLLLLGAIFLAGVTELGSSQWLPAYIEKTAGSTRTGGALGLLAFGATMALGRLLSSWLSHHISPKQFFLIGGLICVISLLLAAIPAPVYFTAGCLAVLGLGISGFWPTILACAGDCFPTAGASMFSTLAALGNFGGVAGPLMIGLVADHWSLRAGMAFLALAPAIAIILLLYLLTLNLNVNPSGE
jgi:MFS family permease